MIDQNTTAFFQSLPFFAGLPAADLEALCAAATIRDLEKKDHLFVRGDRADYFFIVLNGWVRLYRNTQDGEEAIFGLMTRADTIGDEIIFDGGVYGCSAQAAENSRVIAIPAAALRSRARANPELIVRIMQSLSRQVGRLQLENEHLSVMSAPQRVGCLLLQLAAGMPEGSRTVHFPYDKSLAAMRLGMKAETFSRALGQLKPVGITVNGPDIKIADYDHLVDYVCSGCSAENADCRFASIHQCDMAACGKS